MEQEPEMRLESLEIPTPILKTLDLFTILSPQARKHSVFARSQNEPRPKMPLPTVHSDTSSQLFIYSMYNSIATTNLATGLPFSAAPLLKRRLKVVAHHLGLCLR